MTLIYLANSDAAQAYPHTVTRPKSLVKILGHTAIEHNLEQTAQFCDKIIIAVGFKGDMIKHKLGGSFNGKEIIYADMNPYAELTEIIKACLRYINGDFMVACDGGLYSGADIAACRAACGTKLLCQAGQCGLYSFAFAAAAEIAEKGFAQAASRLSPINVSDYFLPLIYPWHILEANVFLLGRFKDFANYGTVAGNVTITGDVFIGRGAVIKDFCYIEGPVFIDENCVIGPFAYIRKDTIIGKRVHLGRAEIFDSVLMDGFTSKHVSYVGHSVVGENCNFGAGTITSDYRHDGQTHITVVNGNKVDTKRRKLGAFLGDDVHTGIGTLLYPGRKIWPGGSTLPGEAVKTDKM